MICPILLHQCVGDCPGVKKEEYSVVNQKLTGDTIWLSVSRPTLERPVVHIWVFARGPERIGSAFKMATVKPFGWQNWLGIEVHSVLSLSFPSITV